MKIASLADVKAKLSAYIRESSNGPVFITRNGKAVAAIVPVGTDEDVERLMIAHSPRLRAVLAEGKEQIRRGDFVRQEDLLKEVEADGKRKPRRKSA